VEPPQQRLAAQILAERQRGYAVLDVQLPGFTGERSVTQAVERFAAPRGGDDFGTAREVARFKVLQDKKIIFPTWGLHFGFERSTRREDFFPQVVDVVRKRSDAYEAIAGQLLQLRQIGQLNWT
jgi:hypothetical protein